MRTAQVQQIQLSLVVEYLLKRNVRRILYFYLFFPPKFVLNFYNIAARDGAGVTPGLRRRRERAERHRSFLKEQQEVAAAAAVNGFMSSADKREDMGKSVK